MGIPWRCTSWMYRTSEAMHLQRRISANKNRPGLCVLHRPGRLFCKTATTGYARSSKNVMPMSSPAAAEASRTSPTPFGGTLLPRHPFRQPNQRFGASVARGEGWPSPLGTPQGGFSWPSANSPPGGRAKRGRKRSRTALSSRHSRCGLR